MRLIDKVPVPTLVLSLTGVKIFSRDPVAGPVKRVRDEGAIKGAGVSIRFGTSNSAERETPDALATVEAGEI